MTAAPTHAGQHVESHCHRCGFEDYEHMTAADLERYPEDACGLRLSGEIS